MKHFFLFALSALFYFTTNAQDYVWAAAIGSTDDTEIRDLVIDRDGYIYVCGVFEGSGDFDPGTGVTTLTSNGEEDGFIQKFDQDSNLVWAINIGGIEDDQCSNLSIGMAGEIYVSGSFELTADFDPGVGTFNMTAADRSDAFVMRLDAAGNFSWAKRMGGDDDEEALEVEVDTAGRVVVGGIFEDSTNFNDAGLFQMISTGEEDLFFAIFDSSGIFLDAKQIESPEELTINDMYVDANGIYATGLFTLSADFDPGAGLQTLTTVGDDDAYVLHLNHFGNYQWAGKLGGTTDDDEGFAIIADAQGNIYAGGLQEGAGDFDPGPGVLNLTAIGDEDAFIVKIDPGGNAVWAKNFGGADDEYVNDLTFDKFGDLYLTGFFEQTVDFDPGAGVFGITAGRDESIYVLKLDTGGNFIFAVAAIGDEDMWGNAIAIGPKSSIYVGGVLERSGTADMDPSPGIINITSKADDGVIWKLNQCKDYLETLNIEICNKDAYLSPSGKLYNIAGTYQDTIMTQFWCDSIYTINLTVNSPDVTVNQSGPNLVAAANGVSYEWVDCNNNFTAISGETSKTFVAKQNGSYAVFITDNNCTDTSACFDVIGIGINELRADQVSIYPNPAIDQVTIELSTPLSFTARLISVSGQMIKEERYNASNRVTFDLPEVQGMYFLQINTTTSVLTEKLLIK